MKAARLVPVSLWPTIWSRMSVAVFVHKPLEQVFAHLSDFTSTIRPHR